MIDDAVAIPVPGPRVPLASIVASTYSTTVVLVVVLVVLGLVMLGVMVWLVRSTRADAPALGPLEMMGTRSWRRAAEEDRVALLEDARPADALPPAPVIPIEDPLAHVAANNGTDGDHTVVDATRPIVVAAGDGEPVPAVVAVLAASAPARAATEQASEPAAGSAVETVETVETVEPVEPVEAVDVEEAERDDDLLRDPEPETTSTD